MSAARKTAAIVQQSAAQLYECSAWPSRAIMHHLGAQLPSEHNSLRRGENETVVEYTLRDAKKPIGVAEYRLLPPALKAQLPEASKLKQVVAEVEVPDAK